MYYPKNKIVFVHIVKTGGSSLEYFLGQLEHPEIFESYKDVKHKMAFLNNLYKKYQFEPEYKRWRIHRSAKEYKNNIPDYDSYYSFSIVRNPFSQIKSLYTMDAESLRKKGKKVPTWGEYLYGRKMPSLLRHDIFLDQKKLLTDNGKLVVKEVFPFEYYEDVVNKLARKLKFIPDFNVKLWSTEPKYEYTPKMITRVMDLYSESFELWQKVNKHWKKTKTPYSEKNSSSNSS